MGKYRWKEFETMPGEQTANKIHATINRRRCIYLNEPAMKAIGDPELVVLMYDSYQQTIGVKAATLEKPNAFRPKKKDSKIGGRVLYAAKFCREFSIKPRDTLAFVRAEVDNEGVLILGMRDTMHAGRKN